MPGICGTPSSKNSMDRTSPRFATTLFASAIALALLAACSSEPMAMLECEYDTACPPGMYCNARGRCERESTPPEDAAVDLAAIDLAMPIDDLDAAALDAGDSSFHCSFFTNTGCPSNHTCATSGALGTSGPLYCRENGTRLVGETCNEASSCGSDMLCHSGRCHQMCHPLTNPCGVGSCLVPSGGLFGLCFGCQGLPDIGCSGSSTCIGDEDSRPSGSCRDVNLSAIPGDACTQHEDCGRSQFCHNNVCAQRCWVDAHCTAGGACNDGYICTGTSRDAGVPTVDSSLPDARVDSAGLDACTGYCGAGATCGSSDGCGGECPGTCPRSDMCAERVGETGNYDCVPSPCPGGCGCGQVCSGSTCINLCAPGTTLCGCGSCCGPDTICVGTECIPFG